ncbi:MAG: polysaccharide pyruvyl transferase CsaB [Clostridia bacterium]|nr:polysaccharide pyruvyl transferase CsaB [Clostridia bacterium]
MKILLASMKMDIGGAETHILELAKGLSKKGHQVQVISEGGIFVKELEQHGIPHICAPLSSKKPKDIITSYKTLKALFTKENFDIVHSHARIPSVLIHILKPKFRFGFVSTLHFAFTKNTLVKKFTVWGEKCLVVSEDLKKHLIRNSRMKSKDITVTVNGINEQDFANTTPDEAVMNELNLRPDSKKIVCVCRLEKGNCDSAYMLLQRAEEINRKLRDIQIVIVGDGDAYRDLSEKADALNRRIGKNTVILTGKRSDVNKIISLADVFVGISRAALEAMAAGKIVVLTGSYGHLGILTQKDFEKMKLSNFTCRGLELPTEQKVARAVCDAYRLDKSTKEQTVSYLKNAVLTEYSSTRMTEDALRVYHELLYEIKQSDIVLSGYYGFRNSGDDAILKMIIQDIRAIDPKLGITILSNRPADTKRIYSVNAVNRWNFFAIRKVMKDSRLFISGGGSVIQDVTSTKSLLYYLCLILMAKRYGNKVMLYANGIGPVRKKANQKRAKNVLNRVDVITLREEDSQDILNEMGVINPKTVVTCDPVVALKDIDIDQAETLLYRHNLFGKPYIVVSLREWKTIPIFEAELLEGLKEIKRKHNCELLFLPMQHPHDVAINQKYAKLTNSVCITKRLSADMCIGLAKHSLLAVGMRLHILIYAFAANVPSIGLAYDPKVESVMRYFGQDTYMGLLEFTKMSFTSKADRILSNREGIRNDLSVRLHELKAKNKINIDFVFKLLNE